MCGIAGVYFKKELDLNLAARFKKSVGLLEHRGPDNFGERQYDNLFLYHHRLSIIDLSVNGNQPFESEKSTLVFNGELYNFRDLARKRKFTLDTTSDTEVLIKSLDQVGLEVLPELNGIFAFANYQKENKQLILGRDRLGVKPLYYVNDENFFAFASEAKVLLDFLEELTFDWQVFSEFLWFGSSVSIDTICTEIKKVEPGQTISYSINSGLIETKKFWNINKDVVPKGILDVSYNTAKNSVSNLLDKALERQCISDVPVGSYLSGGVDSSLVVGLASKFTTSKLMTFSASFEGSSNSELPLAKLVAQKYNTEHHEIEVSTKGLEGEIGGIVFQYDEPFADPAALPLHLLAKKCKGHSKVILQGDGGDEIFGGYGRHLDMSQFKLRSLLAPVLAKLHPSSSYRDVMKDKSKRLNASPFYRKMALLVSHTSSLPIDELINKKYLDKFNKQKPFKVYEKVDQGLSKLDHLTRMLYTDSQIILSTTFMDKVDKINMYNSIEARVPLLDNDLVDYVLRLPPSFKVKGNITKRILKDASIGIVPNEILNARKVSFGTPMSQWLKTILYDFAYQTLENASAITKSIINVDYLKRLLDEHKRGKADYSNVLWRSLVFCIWLGFYGDKLNLSNGE